MSSAEIPANKLVSMLKAKKEDIYLSGEVPGDQDVAPLHALALQLIASGILVFVISTTHMRRVT